MKAEAGAARAARAASFIMVSFLAVGGEKMVRYARKSPGNIFYFIINNSSKPFNIRHSVCFMSSGNTDFNNILTFIITNYFIVGFSKKNQRAISLEINESRSRSSNPQLKLQDLHLFTDRRCVTFAPSDRSFVELLSTFLSMTA